MDSLALKNSSIKADYLYDFVDIVGPIYKWPHSISGLLPKQHLNNQERFKLTVFLLCNGVNPEMIKAYFSDCYGFDAQAWRQINYVIKAYPTSQWKAWNVQENRSI